MWETAPSGKEVIFSEFDFEASELEFEVFFHSYLALSTTNWAQIFTGLLIYAYDEIHRVRSLWSLIITNSVQCFKSWLFSRCVSLGTVSIFPKQTLLISLTLLLTLLVLRSDPESWRELVASYRGGNESPVKPNTLTQWSDFQRVQTTVQLFRSLMSQLWFILS